MSTITLESGPKAPLSGIRDRTVQYRPDVDGLRAVAVLAVVLFHAWPKRFVGGFIGVDVFFVISGFLISSIIIAQLEHGHFSIVEFYSRRIRRIFPALIVVLISTIVFGWVVLLHGEFTQIGKHIAAGSGFVSNLVFWNEAGYFDNLGITKPLLHLWSLGVEEQFYILWPLILWIVFTWRFNFLYVMAAIFCLSMAANVLTVVPDPTAAFYSPVTRFWELMSGGVAAYLQHHRGGWRGSVKEVASVAGAGLLILGLVVIRPQYRFPGWWALLPVTGTFLLIISGPLTILSRFVLGRKIAVRLGLVSYPLYLWHWPLLSFAYIIYGERPTFFAKLAIVGGALILAILTYRFVELPIRVSRIKTKFIAVLTGAMSVVGVIGMLVHFGLIRERIQTNGADIYLDALNDTDFPGPSFIPFRFEGIEFQKVHSQGSGITVFLGDSVVQQYGPYIEHAIASEPMRFHSVIFATAGGCPPIRNVIRQPAMQFPLCRQTAEAAYDLAEQPDIDTVVIGASWYVYLTDPSQDVWFDNGTAHEAFPSPQATQGALESLRESIVQLTMRGKRVFMILPPPMGREFDPRNMYTGSRFGSIWPLSHIENFDLAAFLGRNAAERNRLIAITRGTGAITIEPSDYLCQHNVCAVLDAHGAPVYTDGIHMRPEYSRSAAGYLERTIESASL